MYICTNVVKVAFPVSYRSFVLTIVVYDVLHTQVSLEELSSELCASCSQRDYQQRTDNSTVSK